MKIKLLKRVTNHALQATGLLNGRAATTHWSGLAQLKEAGVNVKESRVVQVFYQSL